MRRQSTSKTKYSRCCEELFKKVFYEPMPKAIKLSTADREALHAVYVLLESNLENAPAMRVLCRKSGLNCDKLKKGFKLLFGSAPHQYHRNLQLKEGQRLLIETEMTVSEIAYLLGYEQSSNFSTAFKKKLGISPLAVRGEK